MNINHNYYVYKGKKKPKMATIIVQILKVDRRQWFSRTLAQEHCPVS